MVLYSSMPNIMISGSTTDIRNTADPMYKGEWPTSKKWS